MCIEVSCFVGFFCGFIFSVYPCEFHSWSSHSLCVAVPFQCHGFGLPLKQDDVPGGAGHLRFFPPFTFIHPRGKFNFRCLKITKASVRYFNREEKKSHPDVSFYLLSWHSWQCYLHRASQWISVFFLKNRLYHRPLARIIVCSLSCWQFLLLYWKASWFRESVGLPCGA